MIDFLGRRGRLVVGLILLTAVGAILLFLHEILFPFLLAGFLSYVLAPAIERIHLWEIGRHQIPRGLAVILVYLFILFALIGGGTYLLPRVTTEMGRLIEEFPRAVTTLTQQWVPGINRKLNEWANLMPQTQEPILIKPEDKPETQPQLEIQDKESGELTQLMENFIFEIRELDSDRLEVIPKRRQKIEQGFSKNGREVLDIQAQMTDLINSGAERLKGGMTEFLDLGRRMLAKFAGSVFTMFLTLMVAAFILVDTNLILRFMSSLVPQEHQQRYASLLSRLDVGLNGVVRGQLLICLVNGILTMIGLILIGVPFAFTLGLVAMVFSLIPIFGTILSTLPIMVMGLTVSMWTGFLALTWILLIHFIEGNFLNPKIMGTAAHIHPVLIVFALVTGEHTAGIAGALLAVPIFSILQTLFLFFKAMVEEFDPAKRSSHTS